MFLNNKTYSALGSLEFGKFCLSFNVTLKFSVDNYTKKFYVRNFYEINKHSKENWGVVKIIEYA